MIENSKSDYLVKVEKEKDNIIDENEIDELIKNTALIVGLEKSKSNKKRTIQSIANWRFPKSIQKMSDGQLQRIWHSYDLKVAGQEVPLPLYSFRAMKFPQPILEGLEKKGVIFPTPIQMQALPAVLSGRDLISISATGTGKTLVFTLPAIMLSLYEENRLPIKSGEGPFGLIVVPSRELAIQIHETYNFFVKHLLKHKENDFPDIKSVLAIGGVDIRYQIEDIQSGCHFIIGTPGRLSDLLEKRKFRPSYIKYVVLDEADRLLDMGFDEEIRKVLEKMTSRKQTLIFSSTMPKKVQEHVKNCLYNPVVVNSGRAGAANFNVRQDVEYIKDESKLIQILETLQKTPPPVLIFCENKKDVDEIHEYLLLKGVDVCAMHGDKDQEDRIKALREFRAGTKEVLVATDIVSKGLDFPAIEHVINYDMPKEIESYVLRIGRTGRLGQYGVATTFINRNQDEAILLDLKNLLKESSQKVPSFLNSLKEEESASKIECSFCGGLGHNLSQCHKLENQRLKSIAHRSIKKTNNTK